MDRFIVQQVFRNHNEEAKSNEEPISKKFEVAINANADKGYKLSDWKYHAVAGETFIAETIIAIFEKEMPQLNPKPS